MTRLIALPCRPAWYLRSFGFAVVFAVLIALSCQKKPTEPKPNDPNRSDTQLRVTSYTLAKGETQEFPAGFEIVASEGIDIAGDLVINPSRDGDFTLRAESGDIRMSGKVMVRKDATTFPGQQVVRDKHSALSKQAAPQGTRLFFILDRPGATISIGRGAQIQSGDGRNADNIQIAIYQGRYAGGPGAPGGDIIIRAHGGKIILADLQPGDPLLFILGNGGHGANIGVDRENFETSGPNLELIGGRGGDSGILFLEADTIEGMPAVGRSDTDLLAGGVGGNGGNVIWDNDIFGILHRHLEMRKTYPLQEIIFRGGDGGNGAIAGGKGGFAAYWSGRVMNERGQHIASVSVTGGNGGDVFPSPLPVGLVQGGEGGECMVIGNFGWDGVHPDSGGPINGADGGDVIGRGGNGGDVLEGVYFQSAIGGDGGNSEVAQTRLLEELALPFQPILGFKTPIFGVISGSGGEGADRADGCPGGNGGSSGTVLAIGGDGGNVPNRSGARGGRGGDLWTARNWLPPFHGASGGNGNPPGKGGCVKTLVTSLGKGGTGFLPGENGQDLGLEFNQEECAPDGELSGAGLNCDDDTTGGKPCWEQYGSTYNAYYEISTVSTSTIDGSISTYFESWAENGTLVRPQYGGYAWERQGTYVKGITRPFGGNVDTTYAYDPNRYVNGGHALSMTWGPRCFGNQGAFCSGGEEFQLYLPGNNFEHSCESFSTGSISRTTYKLQYTGCNTNPELRDYAGGWRCCKTEAIKDDEDCP